MTHRKTLVAVPRHAVLALAIAATGCTGISDSLVILTPLSEAAVGSDQHLSVVVVRSDPDFEQEEEDHLMTQLMPAIQDAGIVGSVTRGESPTATHVLEVTIDQYESTTTMGRFWFGVLAGPAILQAPVSLRRSDDPDPLTTGVARAESSGFGIFAGTNTQTYPAVVGHIVDFLKQTPQ